MAASSEVANLCEEVKLTEASYVEDLRAVLLVYVRPARKLDILSQKEKEEIFSNLEELLLPAEALLEKLSREGEPVATLAEAFIAVAPFFIVYSNYCNNYTLALKTVRRCREAGAFEEFLNSQSSRKESKGLTLESFLIKPVQRLTKYPLFFQSLLKAVPPEHPARARLEAADELVRQVSKSVDESMNQAATGALLQLLKQLRPEFMQLLAPHRQLVGRHNCTFVCENKAWAHAALFVLTDLLLVCKRKGAAGESETSLRPKVLLRLDDLLVGDEAMEDSWSILSVPSTAHHLALACDTGGSNENFRVECASAEKLRALQEDLEGEAQRHMRRRSALRQRQAAQDAPLGAASDASCSDVDELIATLDKLRGAIKPHSLLACASFKPSHAPLLSTASFKPSHSSSFRPCAIGKHASAGSSKLDLPRAASERPERKPSVQLRLTASDRPPHRGSCEASAAAAAPLSSPAAKAFHLALSRHLRGVQRGLLALAAVSAAVEASYAAQRLASPAGWRGGMPCTFQSASRQGELMRGVDVTRLVVDLLLLLPLLAVLLAFARKAFSGGLLFTSGLPYRLLAIAWVWRVLLVVIFYGAVNVGQLVRHDLAARTSCEVALSLVFFPAAAGVRGDDAHSRLRNASARYFANAANHIAPQHPQLELWFASLRTEQAEAYVDDAEGCAAAEDAVYAQLYRYAQPDLAIRGYCAQAAEIVSSGRADEAWPLTLVVEQLQNILAGLTVGERACSPLDAPRLPPLGQPANASRVCDLLSTAPTLESVPSALLPYLGARWKKMAGEGANASAAFRATRAKLSQLRQPFDREAACLLLLDGVDPTTGYPSLQSSLCPQAVEEPHGGTSRERERDLAAQNLAAALSLSSTYGGALPARFAPLLGAAGRAVDGGFFSEWREGESEARAWAGGEAAAMGLHAAAAAASLRASAEAEAAAAERLLAAEQRALTRAEVEAVRNASSGDASGGRLQANRSIAALDEEGARAREQLLLRGGGGQQRLVELQARLADAAAYRALGEAAERIAAAAAAARAAARREMSRAAAAQTGLEAAAFGLSASFGVVYGVLGYKLLAQQFERGRDQAVLHAYSSLLAVVFASAMGVPLLLLLAILFQLLSSYTFALSVFGMAVALVGFLIMSFARLNHFTWRGADCSLSNPHSVTLVGVLFHCVGVAGVLVSIVLEGCVGQLNQEVDLTPLYVVKLLTAAMLNVCVTEIIAVATATRVSAYFFRRLKNVVFIDGSATELGNENADAEVAIHSHGSVRALLVARPSLQPAVSHLWKLSTMVFGPAEHQVVPVEVFTQHQPFNSCKV